jgi:hypothetical protein
MKKIISSFVFIVFAAILPAIAQINEQASNPVKKPLVSEPASGKQTEAMEKVVRDYLLKNPVVIREAMQALQ